MHIYPHISFQGFSQPPSDLIACLEGHWRRGDKWWAGFKTARDSKRIGFCGGNTCWNVFPGYKRRGILRLPRSSRKLSISIWYPHKTLGSIHPPLLICTSFVRKAVALLNIDTIRLVGPTARHSRRTITLTTSKVLCCLMYNDCNHPGSSGSVDRVLSKPRGPRLS